MTMKMLSTILAVTNLMLVWSGFSALPPIQHNYFTTNASPSMISSNAIAATNGFGTNTMLAGMKGTNAWFYSEGAAGNNFVIYGDTQPQITFQGDVGSAVIQGYIGLIIKPGPGGGGMGDIWITTNVYVHGLISTNVPMFLSTNLADQWWVSNLVGSMAVTNFYISYFTNLTVQSNLYVLQTNFNNYNITTNLTVKGGATFNSTVTVETNVYVFQTNFVNYFYTTNIANLPGPIVLLPGSSTNGYPGALVLSNAPGITFHTNGGFLIISNSATSGAQVATNSIELLAAPPVPGELWIDCSTSQWKWITNNVQTNTTFLITNLVTGSDITLSFMGDTAIDWSIYWTWPANVVATWMTATQSYVLSNHVAIVSISVRNSTNVLVAGKDQP